MTTLTPTRVACLSVVASYFSWLSDKNIDRKTKEVFIRAVNHSTQAELAPRSLACEFRSLICASTSPRSAVQCCSDSACNTIQCKLYNCEAVFRGRLSYAAI